MIKNLLLLLLLIAPLNEAIAVSAFPGAVGGGAASAGGRLGVVMQVTNLNDSGAGSLRACVETTGARTCVFTIGGTIHLLTPLAISAGRDFLTIAGQTAPGGGIQLESANVNSELIDINAHDIIIRYIRLRKGYAATANGWGGANIKASGSTNIMFDHLSLAWSMYDSLGLWSTGTLSSVTVQNSIIAEGLATNISTVTQIGASTSTNAALVTNVDFYHNFISGMDYMAPFFGGLTGREVNDITYNSRSHVTQIYGGTNYDGIANVKKLGPMSPTSTTGLACAQAPTNPAVYNVRNYNAQGNGSTDDTDAIQAAINAVPAGGTVYIPDGTYMIEAVNKHLDLKSNMTLSMSSGAILKAMPYSGGAAAILLLDRISNVNVIGGTLDGNRDGHIPPNCGSLGTPTYCGEAGMGISSYDSSNLYYERVISKNNHGDGFYAGGYSATPPTNINLCYVTSDNNRRQGMSVISVNGMIISHSIFKNTIGTAPQAGIDLEPNTGNTVRNVQILDSVFTGNNNQGIVLYQTSTSTVTNNTIMRNVVSTNRDTGIYSVNSSYATITNNTIQNNPEGVNLDSGSTHITLTNNIISQNRNGNNILNYGSGNTISNNDTTAAFIPVPDPITPPSGTTPIYEYEALANTGTSEAPTGNPSIYLTGNMGWNQTSPAGDQWAMARQVASVNGSVVGQIPVAWQRATPLTAEAYIISPESALTLATNALPIVGAYQKLNCDGSWAVNRDSVDTRLINEYSAGTGISAPPANETAVGGYPTLAAGTACSDKDADGMPDIWEETRGYNPNNPLNRNKVAANGYTYLENYLNGQ